MHLGSFKRLATVSAIALTASMYSGSAFAVSVQSGAPTTIPMHATVLNTFTVTTTPLLFGTFGATPKAGNQAQAVLTPAGILTDAPGGGNAANARIAKDPTNGPTVSSVTVVGLGSTQVKVDYSNIVNMINGAGTFVISSIDDNLNSPVTGVGGVAGHGGAVPTQGNATTLANGHLDFSIGGKFQTSATATPYVNGLYVGSFDVTLSY